MILVFWMLSFKPTFSLGSFTFIKRLFSSSSLSAIRVVSFRQRIKKQRQYFANKSPSSQSYGFSRSHVWMWDLDNKKGWALKNWCLQTVVLESPLDSKEIKPVNPKGNETWIFSVRTDAEAEAPILWPSDAKSQLTGKDPDAGKDWGQEEKGATENEMVGWHHGLNGHEFRGLWKMVKDRKTWCAIVHGVAKSQTWLSHWTRDLLYTYHRSHTESG